MNTVTVKNLSTFTDHAALMRVALLMSGDEYCATHDDAGMEVVAIKADKGNVYTVLDKARREPEGR